jgi:hypothetical protein
MYPVLFYSKELIRLFGQQNKQITYTSIKLLIVIQIIGVAGKEETPKCRKKTVKRTNEMIEVLIDFIEIHPIVAFEAIYEPMWMHFYSIQVRSSILIQVSCMVYTIKKLEFKKLEWRLGCKTCIVYTGLNRMSLVNDG